MPLFTLKSKYKPTGDQPEAIRRINDGLAKGFRDQTILGVTGSGKTFTMANIIASANRPTLIISHNKTLAAQLYGEFSKFFPDAAVHYFVSYYDYYQPEAYIPHTDTYIEKEATINEEIDRLRHAATQSLLSRRDVIIVASVSCIYGLGSPADYAALGEHFTVGQTVKRNELLRRLVRIQYQRNDIAFERGQFRAKGDAIDIHLATGEEMIRINMYGDKIEEILISKIKVPNKSIRDKNVKKTAIKPSPEKDEPVHRLGAENQEVEKSAPKNLDSVFILPAKHFMTPETRMKTAIKEIRAELKERLDLLLKNGKIVEADRLERKCSYDLEMMEELGYCNGIENYSRHLSGRATGLPPETLIDFFPPDFLLFVDESHATLPQIRGMSAGDRSRKDTLVEFGFRLPSARDNRPLTFEEFDAKIKQAIYVSATPAEYELNISKTVAEQIIRPTGLLDPEIEVRAMSKTAKKIDTALTRKQSTKPARDLSASSLQQTEITTSVAYNDIVIIPAKNNNPIEDLIEEIEKNTARKQRTLVTTLTKRMAEELADYLAEAQIKSTYLHSEVDTMERVEILRDLRSGVYDVLVGINLLREGLDLPEVSLVAILDADIQGFLRNETSLMQTMGRAARHIDGRVIMYADTITPAMRVAITKTRQRRLVQAAYNKKHGITPRSTTN